MDWNAAIEKNREALKRVLAMLVAMAEFSGGRATLPRHLHRAILRLLRPAEAAARRLVIVAARGLAAPPQARNPKSMTLPPPRPRKAKPPILRNGVGTGIVMPRGALPDRAGSARPVAAPRQVVLPLFDPLYQPFQRRRAPRSGVPRICFPGYADPFPVAPLLPLRPSDPIDASRLNLRLAALASALDDLPRHIRRFAHWQARRAEASADAQGRNHSGRRRTRRVSPLRPGRPPGAPRVSVHEVHDILDVVHGLAFRSLQRPDT